MQPHTSHADLTKTAIGYVRVSTPEQAKEGVRLGAQRDKLKARGNANGIRLIDIIADEASATIAAAGNRDVITDCCAEVTPAPP